MGVPFFQALMLTRTGLSLPAEVQPAEQLLASLSTLRAADIATLLHQLSAKRRMEVARELDDEQLADVLEELPEDDQVEIMQVPASSYNPNVLTYQCDQIL